MVFLDEGRAAQVIDDEKGKSQVLDCNKEGRLGWRLTMATK